MKRLLSFITVLSAACLAWAAEPDFAYPQKVLTDAEASYAAATASGDGVAKIRSLLEITVAKTAIDPDSLRAMPQRISAAAARENDPATRAIMLIMEAQVRDRLYDESLYGAKSDQTCIRALADSALTLALTVPNERLSRFDRAISTDAVSKLYFPTVADFVAARCADLYALPRAYRKQLCSRMSRMSREGSWPWAYWTAKTLSSANAPFDKWLTTYYDYSAYESARIFLEQACDKADGTSQQETLITLLKNSLSDFPGYWDNERLQRHLDQILQPRVEANFASIIAPGLDLKVKISYKYASNAGAQLYKVKNTDRKYAFDKRSWEKAERKTAETDATKASGDTTLTFTINDPGIYAILPVLNDSVSEPEWYSDFIYCTPFIPVAFNGCTEQAVVTADCLTGAPLPGVSVTCDKTGGALGTTDSNGTLTFKMPSTVRYSTLSFKYKNIGYNFRGNISASSPWDEDHSTTYESRVFTSRPLYHPGDTLEWSTVIAKRRGNIRELAKISRFTVSLMNANGETVADQQITTDTMGRADGIFAIPTDGLTGNYAITILSFDNKQWVTQQSVTVSDFKMPEFELKTSSVERTSEQVIIAGTATTYAGMPVADGQVSASVTGAYRYRWFTSAHQEVWNSTTSTDSLGRYIIEIPQQVLEESEFDCFIAEIRVDDQAGNSASTSEPFTTGKPYVLSADIDNDTHRLDASKKNSLTVKAFTPSEESVEIAVRWELKNRDEVTVVSGETTSGATSELKLKDVPAGRYTLVVSASDPTLADAVEVSNVTIYNTKKGTMPEGDIFFLPSLSAAAENGHATISIGVPADNTYLYIALCSGKNLLSLDVLKRNKGFADITVDLPDGVTSAVMKVFAASHGKTAMESIDITVPDKHRLKLEGESFRDHITPGATEHWRLRLSSDTAGAEAGALIATMYNRALEGIKAMRWPSDFSRLQQWPRLSTSLMHGDINELSISKDLASRTFTDLLMPDFNPKLNIGYRAYNYPVQLRGTSKAMAKAEAEAEEIAVADFAASSGGLALYKTVQTAADSDSGAETAEEAEAPVTNSDAFDFRDAEVLQAFWMPRLDVAEDGTAEIEFDVPQANTTWTFRAFAWNDDIRSAQMVKQILANKPVMVEANLPRFLRTGDSADVVATIYNNSDTTEIIATTVEIFDINGKIISTDKFSNTIEPKEAATATVRIDASDTQAAIGYRVRSESTTFSDGEQAFIPVLPSLTTVVESETFYLNPGDETFTMELPSSPDARLTLQYCQNPTWNVIKALPTLSEKAPKTALQASNTLFGAYTAKGLKALHPEISEVIDEWNSNPSDSALVSRLATNESLKIALLQSTPWVQASENATERMARLLTLFDSKEIASAATGALTKLTSLQNTDGGFRWGEWSERSSSRVTCDVIERLGYLNAIGFLPNDSKTRTIIANAFRYIDATASASSSTPTQIPVAYLHSLFPDIEPSTTAKAHIAAQVQSIIKNWKEASTAEKARDALILNANSYQGVAREIMNSISEFAVTSATLGTSFPSVYNIDNYTLLMRAFSEVSGDDKILDGMRQWLILREQANEGFAAGNPAALVAGLLTRGSDWCAIAPKDTPVTINGHAVATDRAETATGYIVATLPTFGGGTELAVTPPLDVPSYGSVMSVRTATSRDVKPHSCDALSVSKRLMVKRDGEWVETTALNRGEEVQAVLTLDVTRDLQYVTIIDERPAAFEPVDQLPGWVYAEHLGFYRENRDSETNLFIEYLPRGRYQLAIDMSVNLSGIFTSGIATAQSQLAPEITAHSAGSALFIK